MRLLAKSNIYHITFFLLAFIIGGFILYKVISDAIYSEVDEELLGAKQDIMETLKKTDTVPNFQDAIDCDIIYSLTNARREQFFGDTSFFSKDENEVVQYRTLCFTTPSKSKNYKFVISKSLIEPRDLVKVIVKSMLFVFLILLALMFLVNYYLSRRIWKPFYNTLQSLENFDLRANIKPDFMESNITEFKKLNVTLVKMTNKMSKDFSLQKEFTENASHEIQTPLAIIKSKLELLIQKEDITTEQAKLVQDIYEAINRLSKLNRGLLLLMKIENEQFKVKENIDIAQVLRKHLTNFEELISQKNIELQSDFSYSPQITIHPLLADILVSNLISNAIKHNITNGKITISLSEKSLVIENTGTAPDTDPVEFFERFRKDKSNPDSIGLGLSIVKKVAEINGMQINYTFEEGMHAISLSF